MKVTVCFDRVRVVVPCADGTLTVSDLTDKAVARFLKATGKSPSQRICVRKLIASSDGGFLDPSDRLRDVVDDRDQIVAIFEECPGVLRQHSVGDGTSGSSVSASSPEMFPDDQLNENDFEYDDYGSKTSNGHVMISALDVLKGSDLIVRRGSEPVLNLSKPVSSVSGGRDISSEHCHTSTKDHEVDSDSGLSGSDTTDQKKSQNHEADKDQRLQFQKRNFVAAMSPKEQASEPCNAVRSVECQDKFDVLHRLPEKEPRNFSAFSYCSRDIDVRSPGEPRLTPTSPPSLSPPPVPPRKHATQSLAMQNSIASGRTNTRILGKKIFLQLVKGPNGLGFSVTTRDNPAGGNCPIYIKNIMPRGAAVEDGQLQTGDRLLQVNNMELTGKSQSDVVSILRGIPEGSMVNLVISRQEFLETNLDLVQENSVCKDNSCLPESSSADLESAIPNLEKNLPDDVPGESCRTNDVEIFIFDIFLDPDVTMQGLGVTLKGRTASTSNGREDLGVFIKSVIAGGAAHKDGRLKPNDQVCEVNGICLLNRSNLDATNILRSAIYKESSKPEYVKIIVARKTSPSSLNTNQKETDGLKVSRSNQDVAWHLEGNFQDGNILQVSSSRSLHNRSYQQAINNAMLREIVASSIVFNSKDVVKQNNLPAVESLFQQMQTMVVTKTEGKYTEAKCTSTETLDLDCKNSDVIQDISSSDTESRTVFQREGFGRQSMSEKRKGHLDPRTTEVYQKIKQKKGRFCSASLDRKKSKASHSKEGSVKSLDTGSDLRGKLSASLESLQSEFHQQEPGAEEAKGASSKCRSRLRAVNNSFRAAVDRSYENDADTEVEMSDSFKDESATSLNEKSVSSKDLEDDQVPKKEKASNRLIGLGGILRFGKSKKADGQPEDASRVESKIPLAKCMPLKTGDQLQSSVIPEQHSRETKPLPIKQINHQNDQSHHGKSPGPGKPETVKSQLNQILSKSASPSHSFVVDPQESPQCLQATPQKCSTPSSTNRLLQLREEHQKRHCERQHRYPLDSEEDMHERLLSELQNQKVLMQQEQANVGNLEASVKLRTRNEVPGSRIPYLGRPMSAGHHYQNVDVIRSQIQLHDEYQMRYKNELRRQQQQKHLQPLNHLHQQQQKQQQQYYQLHGCLPIKEQSQQHVAYQQQQQPYQQLQQLQPPTAMNEKQPQIQHQYSHSYSYQLHSHFPTQLQQDVLPQNHAIIRDDNHYAAPSQVLGQPRPDYRNIPTPNFDQRFYLDYDRYCADRKMRPLLPTKFHEVSSPDRSAAWQMQDNEYYCSNSSFGSIFQKSERRHYYC